MAVTFDGDNLRIILPGSTTELDTQIDLYSDWKEWVKLSDNAKYLKAFDTVGGDPISASQDVAGYYFLRNDSGWRIRPAEEAYELAITGNLYGRDPTLPIFTPTAGGYVVLITIERSASSLRVTVPATRGLTPGQLLALSPK